MLAYTYARVCAPRSTQRAVAGSGPSNRCRCSEVRPVPSPPVNDQTTSTAARSDGRAVDPRRAGSSAGDQIPVRVGVLGCGNVGAALVQLVASEREVIARRTGVLLEITRVAVRNLSRDRDVSLADGVLTRDAHDVVNDPNIDVVVEVIGGIEPARTLLLAALGSGKGDRKSTRLNSSHERLSRMPSSA